MYGMYIKSFFKTFVLHYFLIYGLTMIATFFFNLIFNGTAATVEVSYFGWAMLFSLAADLPLVVFISQNELSGKSFYIRIAIHAIVLEALLMPIGYVMEMWRGAVGGVVFFFIVLFVDAAMYALQFLNHKLVADNINRGIKNFKKARTADERLKKDGDGDIGEE